MFYLDVFKAFYEKNIRYLVVGAIAMNLHGAPRMTADLDILADLGRGNLVTLLEAVQVLGYRPRLPVSAQDLLDPRKRQEWINERRLIAFTFFHPKIQYQEIDLLLESPISFDSAYQTRSVVTVESIQIPVMSIDHLIEMKRRTGREQDAADIQVLERIKHLRSQGKQDA